jgi:hypothetical protein
VIMEVNDMFSITSKIDKRSHLSRNISGVLCVLSLQSAKFKAGLSFATTKDVIKTNCILD